MMYVIILMYDIFMEARRTMLFSLDSGVQVLPEDVYALIDECGPILKRYAASSY
jgi:hypothetical protein